MFRKFITIWSVFFKTGLIGFGGGSALIPVIEKEIVDKKKWFTYEEYLKHTVIANITPGTLPVKLGAIAGYEVGGGFGSLIGAYALTLPGTIFTVILLTLFSILGDRVTHYIEFASVGISMFIINLLIIYVFKIMNNGKEDGLYKTNILICLLAFILTGGKEIRNIIFNLLELDKEYIKFTLFDISTISLITIAFFMILFYGLLKSKKSLLVGIMISFIYALINGKSISKHLDSKLSSLIMIIMVVLVIYAMIKHRKREEYIKESIKIKISKQAIIAIGLFLMIPIILVIIIGVFYSKELGSIVEFTSDVAISTATSFGGGESYVSVADGFFVQTGFIEASDFYNKVVSIANALPGPILVKIVAGIGFIFGGSIQGVLFGWLISILAMTTAVGICSVIAILVLIGYDALKNSKEINLIKKYILPVVCGMLLSTSLSMIAECMKVTNGVGISGTTSLLIMIISVYGLYNIHKKYHINDLIMLFSSAICSFTVLSLW